MSELSHNETLANRPQLSELIDGRYFLEADIGSGSLGRVFRAVDRQKQSPVAIKFLHAGALADEGIQARFRREARAVGSLSHPGIVGIHYFGKDHLERPYLVMDLIEGSTMAAWRTTPPPLDVLLGTIDAVLDALAYTHARGVIHRDLKPDNILLENTNPPQPRITDFGLAYARIRSSDITRPDQRIGSPAYMAPEQAAGGVQGPETDIYAVGTMLFELLSGALPFDLPSPIELLVRKLNEPPPPLIPRAGYELPEGLAQIVLGALTRKPEQRYRLAADFRRALAPFLDRPPEILRLPSIMAQHMAHWP